MPRGRLPTSELVRFENKFEPITESGCWIWGGKSPRGSFLYGGRNISAYRAAWLLFRGTIPTGIQVCHKCDVPACVNPQHLFLGTQSDNIRDMYAKGRGPDDAAIQRCNAARKRGAAHPRPMAKLTPDMVRDIRAAPWPQKDIARQFGVSQQTISRVKRGQLWSHV